MEWYLPVIWAVLIGTAVALYVILDGFDLGVGILFPTAKTERERDLMMNSVAPFWDGNETWLVLGGGGLWVAFPQAYAVIMPAFYLPVILMLLALVLRGVSFEFRWVAQTSKKWWNLAFFGGSLAAGFFQGVILGGLIQGIAVRNGAVRRRAVRLGDAVRGAVRPRRDRGLRAARRDVARDEDRRPGCRTRARAREALLLLVLAFMAVVSAWTPIAFERIAARWFTAPNIFFLWPVPLVTAVVAWACWEWLEAKREVLPFLAAILLFVLGYLGIVISNYPYLVPPTLTVWQTAAHPSSQIFMLIGTLILLPIILGYIVFVYWIFRGKVREGEGYH